MIIGAKYQNLSAHCCRYLLWLLFTIIALLRLEKAIAARTSLLSKLTSGTLKFLCGCSHPYVDGIWGIWGSCNDMPKAIFVLLEGDCSREPKTGEWD